MDSENYTEGDYKLSNYHKCMSDKKSRPESPE